MEGAIKRYVREVARCRKKDRKLDWSTREEVRVTDISVVTNVCYHENWVSDTTTWNPNAECPLLMLWKWRTEFTAILTGYDDNAYDNVGGDGDGGGGDDNDDDDDDDDNGDSA